jgi:choline-glycine betaine transporter
VFYWAWALSWSPFAGLFIARISKGRTVREVAFTGIVATSGATIPWFTFVGGTAVWAQHNGIADFGAVIAGEAGPEVSGFILFEALNFTLNLGGASMTIPIGSVLIYAFMILVTTFFVTSADSSTLAVSMMTTGGKAKPSNINRIFWGVVLGMTAAILMILGGTGSANTLQQAAIITGTPFALVCFLAMLALIKDFGENYDQVLFQKETVLWGSGEEPDSRKPPVESAGSDDD